MIRNKKIIYTVHCVLNQNSVIKKWERSTSSFKNIIHLLLDNDISIIQLPCPELKHLGLNRPPLSKEAYDTKDYRQLCSKLAKAVVKEMLTYKKEDYKIIGLIGIEESPTCDSMENPGIFMEELLIMLEENNLKIPTFDIPADYLENDEFTLENDILKFLSV